MKITKEQFRKIVEFKNFSFYIIEKYTELLSPEEKNEVDKEFQRITKLLEELSSNS